MTRSFWFVSCLFLAACGGGGDTEALPEEVYGVRGVYEGTRFEGTTVTVDHEAVPDLMDAMRMDFRLADTAGVAHLRPGQKVRFHIAVTADGARAFGFERLPDSTRLVLAGSPAPADTTATDTTATDTTATDTTATDATAAPQP